MMNIAPNPVNSYDQFKGMLSPFYVVGDYNGEDWNSIRVDLWIWKGAHDAMVSEDPTYVLSKHKINLDDDRVEINIAEYVRDRINPTFSPVNALSNNSDNCFFYYEIRYFNNNDLVQTTNSDLMIGTLGWRYDFQMFDILQPVDAEYFADGHSDIEFGQYNLQSKLNHFKYTSEMVDTGNKIFFTNRSLPIENITTSKIYYNDLSALISPNQIECSPYSYAIAFINKAGNWDLFPIYGKVGITVDKSSTKYNRGFRYKTDFSDRYQNSVREVNNKEEVTYTVNTGKLSSLMSNYLESIVYSPMMFIVDYSTNIAYPVKLESSTFNRKNVFDNKNDIQHTLTFKGDNPKKLTY